MQTPIYLLSWVAAFCALWLLWGLAIKKLFLDRFRERLFELRFELFRMGMSGELPFDSETYRSLETLMCGMLRFGHRITFLTYVFCLVEQERAKKNKEYVDFSGQLALKISRMEPDARQKLIAILEGLRRATNLYMAFTSLFFLSIFALYLTGKILRIWQLEEKTNRITFVVEREAYRAETMRSSSLAIA